MNGNSIIRNQGNAGSRLRDSSPLGQRLGSNSQARRHIAKYAAVLLTAFICAGCTEASREPDISAEDSGLGSLPDGRTWLKLNAEITQTSKTEAAINETFPYEKGVFGLEYRIFDDNGLFEASCTGSLSNTVAMDVSVGWKTVVATANIARLMGVRFLTLKDLMEYTVENLDIFSDSNGVLKFMPMRSISRIYVGESGHCETMAMERLHARLILNKLTNELEGAYAGKSIIAVSLFPANVVTNCKLSGTMAAEPTWYNKAGMMDRPEGEELTSITTAVADSGWPSSSFYRFNTAQYLNLYALPVAHGKTIPIWDEAIKDQNTKQSKKPLYVFPNSIRQDCKGYDEPFTPRYTRLVLCCRINSVADFRYYPISIKNIHHNCTYVFNITIKGPGSGTPDAMDWYGEDTDIEVDLRTMGDDEDDYFIVM